MSGLPFRIRNPLNKLKNVSSKFTSKDELLSMILTTNLPKNLQNTPLQFSNQLSRETNASIFLKREDLQPTFSFFIRGCMNELQQNNIDSTVITSSIGSRGYCLAYCAQKLNLQSLIFMPKSISHEKQEMVKFFGAKIELYGENINETNKYMKEISIEKNYTTVSSHESDSVIAGCGTIALELFKQLSDMDAIFVPVGGGSMIAGITHVVKSMHPHIKVIGVEYEKQNILYDSLMKGYRIAHEDPGLHGISVSQINQKVIDICDEYLDDIILVNENDIHSAIRSCFIDTRTVVEPHGALAVAGAKHYCQNMKHNDKQKKYICIVSDAANLIRYEMIHQMYTL